MILNHSIGVLVVLKVYHPNRGDDIAHLTNRDLLLAAVPFMGLKEYRGRCAIEG
jgi:hypothetical protein